MDIFHRQCMEKRSARAIIVTAFVALGVNSAEGQQSYLSGTNNLIDPRGAIIANETPGRAFSRDMEVQEGDLPARLRFNILGQPISPNWSIVIEQDSEQLILNQQLIAASAGARDFFELPVQTRGPVKFLFSTDAPSLSYDALIRLGRNPAPLFKISKNLVLRYFNSDFRGDIQRIQMAEAVVRLQFDVESQGLRGQTTCTGFQYAPGLILTSLHCIDMDERPVRSRRFTTIYFGIDDSDSSGKKTIGEVVLRGNIPQGQTAGGLDFAVLKLSSVPGGFEAARLPLPPYHISMRVSEPIELFQYWSGAGGSKRGKASSNNPECQLGSQRGTPSILSGGPCPFPDFFHGCDTEPGSSGSPVLLANTGQLVGVHFGGPPEHMEYCAVSSEAIRSRLLSHPDPL